MGNEALIGLALILLPIAASWLVFGFDVAATRIRYEYWRRH